MGNWLFYNVRKLIGQLLVTFVIMQFAPFVSAQGVRIDYTIPFTQVSPQIDGKFSSAEWGSAATVELTNETHPTQNIPALVNTTVYIMEDGENFYLAFVASDPEPEKIRAFYRDRDAAWNDDMVGVIVDTFNDERRAFEFFSTPLGVQMDLTLDDVNGGEDSSWNAIWDSMGSINETGFVVEMKIPLRQLRFPGGQDQQTWGIDLLRFYPRDNRHRLTMNTWDFDISCYLCQLKKAQGFEGLEPKTNLQLIPALTASMADNRPDPLTDDWARDGVNTEAGVDLRWGINQDLYLNATLNPDFSQVEADNAQLNVNNTFSLFFPERREFFLDGADYFNMSERIVHTRNISDPDYGVKLTGKKDANTYGVFITNDTMTNILIPGPQSSKTAMLDDVESQNVVMRYRRDIGINNSTLGVVFTGREAQDYSNTLVGVDGNIRLGDSDQISFLLMDTRSEYPGEIQDDFSQKAQVSDSAYTFRYNHNDNKWNWRILYKDFGEDFRPDMGFINRVGVKDLNLGGNRNWRFGADSMLNRVGLGLYSGRLDDYEGNRLSEWSELNFSAEGPWQSYMTVGMGPQESYFNGEFFDTDFVYLFFQLRPTAGMFFGMNVSQSNSIDYANTRQGESFTISPEFGMRIGKHFQFNIKHNFQNFDVDEGQLYSTNLSDIRLTYQFSIRSFIRAIVQYSDTRRNPDLYSNFVNKRSKSLTTQLLYSYKVNAQTKFFVGYGDSGMENDALDRIEKTNHSLFAKFSYAWQY